MNGTYNLTTEVNTNGFYNTQLESIEVNNIQSEWSLNGPNLSLTSDFV